MRRKNIHVLLLFFGFIILLCVSCNKGVNLKLNLKKGEKYSIENDIKNEITQEIEGQKINSSTDMKIVYSFDVEDVDKDKNVLLKVYFDSIYVKQLLGNGFKIEYDSKNPKKSFGEFDEIYSFMLDKTFTIKLSPNGEVKEIIGLTGVFSDLFEKLNISNEMEKEQIRGMLEEMFGDEVLTDQIQNILSYPDEPIKEGSTWTEKFDTNVVIPMRSETEYTVKEIKDNLVKVDVDSTMKTSENAKPTEIAGIKVKYNITGTQKGNMEIDANNGLPVKVKLIQNITGEVKMSSDIPDIEEQIIPMNTVNNITVNIIKK